MKPSFLILIFLFGSSTAAPALALDAWLDEEVVYIITAAEASQYKSLKTDAARQEFIEQFWLRRDPTPDTFVNEYRDEHYKRIAYANAHFAAGLPGWKTDRGRIYIVHGPPLGIESHPGGPVTRLSPKSRGGLATTSTFPYDVWYYASIPGIGTAVSLEFVDASMSGEYRLTTNPDDKDALKHIARPGYVMESQDTYDPATAALSRLELEKSFSPPEIRLKDLDSVVTTKLSFNVLPFDLKMDFLKASDQTVMVPLTIQVSYKDLDFVENDGVRTASLHILGQVTEAGGRVAAAFDEIAALKESPAGRGMYQKKIELRPGSYRFDVALQDKNSGHTGSFSQDVTAPQFAPNTLALSSLILADAVATRPEGQSGSGSFVLGNATVSPNVKEEFISTQNLNVWLQVYGLKLDDATRQTSFTVETIVTKEGKELMETLDDGEPSNSSAATVIQTIPLALFEPGEYSLEMKITDEVGKKSISSSRTFTIQ